MTKFAVIGCGGIALKATIPALMNSGSSSVSVCIDTLATKEELIRDQFDLPFETSLDVALKKYNFEAVYIATPVGSHKNIIELAAKNGKHILCEKSLAINENEAKYLTTICEENKVALFEGFMYQFHTQHEVVRKLIENGEIGEPFLFQAWFGFPPFPKENFRYSKDNGGGAILDAAAYTVHAARQFFKQEPIHVLANSTNENEEVEIRGSAMFDFGNGKTAHIAYGFNNMYQNHYTIWGTKGTLHLERAFSLPADFSSTLLLKTQREQKEFRLEACDHFIEEIKFFCANKHDRTIQELWRNEIQNQSKILSKL